MFLNKINLFLAISICLIFSFLINNDVKSEEAKKISGIAKVTDGDTIQIEGKKIRFFGIDAPEKKQQCRKPWLTISFISFSKDYPCGKISTDKLKKKINQPIKLFLAILKKPKLLQRKNLWNLQGLIKILIWVTKLT